MKKRVCAENIPARYVKLTSQIRVLSSPDLTRIQNEEAYQKRLTKNFKRIRELSAEIRDILDTHLQPLLGDARPLREEEIAFLEDFSRALFDAYQVSDVDIPLRYRITSRLLQDAEQKDDVAYLIRTLDQKVEACFAMMHISQRLDACDDTCYQYRDIGLEAAKRLLSYLPPEKFLALPDDASRELVLINARYICALFHRSDNYCDEINRSDMQILLDAIALADDPVYQKAVPNYDWNYHRFRAMEYISGMTELNNVRRLNREQLERIYHITEDLLALWESDPAFFAQRCPRAILELYLARIRFLTDRIDIEEYKHRLKRLIVQGSAPSLALYDNVIHLLVISEYLLLIDRDNISKQDERLLWHYYRQVVRYLRDVPKTGSVSTAVSFLTIFLSEYIDLSNSDRFEQMLLSRIITSFHPQTYAHSLSVADIATALAAQLLKIEPERFIGFQNYRHVEDVLSHKKEILHFIRQSCLYHDIGKVFVIEIIMTYGRDLLPVEFSLIKSHPEIGGHILEKHPATAPFANIARYHHRFYDLTGGYPAASYKRLKERVIIDIVRCADCLDAATDQVGRSYKPALFLQEVIREFKEGSGTLYAPYVVDLFEDEKLLARLKKLLSEGRKKNYRRVFRIVSEKKS